MLLHRFFFRSAKPFWHMFAGILLTGCIGNAAADEIKPIGVVELFTSQGCSSCPPADAALGVLSERKDLISLAYHVDYWDYIGWKDTFAKPQYTERQQAYAIVRGDRRVYTPQAMINGRVHKIGSYRRQIEQTVSTLSRRGQGLSILLSVARSDSGFQIKVGAAERSTKKTKATILLVSYWKRETVTIKRGENRGRKLDYFNIVRSIKSVGSWKGEAASIDFPTHNSNGDGALSFVVLLQAGDENQPGPILGAVKLAEVAS